MLFEKLRVKYRQVIQMSTQPAPFFKVRLKYIKCGDFLTIIKDYFYYIIYIFDWAFVYSPIAFALAKLNYSLVTASVISLWDRRCNVLVYTSKTTLHTPYYLKKMLSGSETPAQRVKLQAVRFIVCRSDLIEWARARKVDNVEKKVWFRTQRILSFAQQSAETMNNYSNVKLFSGKQFKSIPVRCAQEIDHFQNESPIAVNKPDIGPRYSRSSREYNEHVGKLYIRQKSFLRGLH